MKTGLLEFLIVNYVIMQQQKGVGVIYHHQSKV